MQNPEQMINILIYLLVGVVVILFILLSVGAVILIKNRMQKSTKIINKEEDKPVEKKSLGMNKQSIHNFMEFDTVDDNMIIQNNGKRFLMVIECQGINYDLMSGVEKAGVEEGFVQFLNTLRHPIQIYTQTRTVNLEESIGTYKEKVRKIEDKLNRMKNEYEQMVESETYSQEELDKAFFELTKQTNLYEYGRDIVADTEKMNLNKNILNKKYYIIVPYYASELAMNDLDKEETKNLAFSEIYTRAQSLIRAIAACGVRGKILRSNELVELLYMAYNRDEAEVFGIDKAIRAGFDEIYSTAPDVLDKKMKELNKYIEEKALEKAKEKVDEVVSEREQRITEKQNNLDDLIDEMAKLLIEENEEYLGKEIAEEAKNKISKNTKEGGKQNGSEEKPKTRRKRVAKQSK